MSNLVTDSVADTRIFYINVNHAYCSCDVLVRLTPLDDYFQLCWANHVTANDDELICNRVTDENEDYTIQITPEDDGYIQVGTYQIVVKAKTPSSFEAYKGSYLLEYEREYRGIELLPT